LKSNSVIQSFGRLDRKSRRSASMADALFDLKRGNTARTSWLALGNGRSYGDSAQSDSGMLVRSRESARILSFDAQTGTLAAEPGVTLGEIILHVGPHGWFLPVTPGTKHVTLGGAIANDVHGKNHHRRGSFCAHVIAFDLLRSDGVTRRCSAREHINLFSATIGGFGLTGMIVSASIQLMKVGSADVSEQVTPFKSLEQYLELAEDADQANEYAVAWLDQLNAGGRGLLMTANHAEAGAFVLHHSKPKLTVPFQPPLNCLNGISLSAFNALYFNAKSRNAGVKTSAYDGFFYPLDQVGNWNFLYGPKGLYQHQSVIPFEAASSALPQLLAASRKAGQASFLTVLKRFGTMASPSMTPFARPGYTLTLDFPNRGAKTLALLSELDRITVEAGGAVNAYKDARMSAQTFAASYPNWHQLEALRDPAFVSDFWRRTALAIKE
jgi:FAD/FMN-containing dehydrogenase